MGSVWRRPLGIAHQTFERPYFSLSAPKSTGREYFNRAWLSRYLEKPPQKYQSRHTSHTGGAHCVDDCRCHFKSLPNVSCVPVCGGGRLNTHVMQRLALALHARGHQQCFVEPTEYWHIDGDAVEAAAFAWLAYRRHYLLPGNMPEVTGANGARVLGAIYPG